MSNSCISFLYHSPLSREATGGIPFRWWDKGLYISPLSREATGFPRPLRNLVALYISPLSREATGAVTAKVAKAPCISARFLGRLQADCSQEQH